jgi:hypothetical protein
MVAWRGHLSFKLYLPDKPDKFGVKLFILCDSSNGYSSRFEIYHGSDNNPSPKGKIYDLVMRLMNPEQRPILFHNLRKLGTGGFSWVIDILKFSTKMFIKWSNLKYRVMSSLSSRNVIVVIVEMRKENISKNLFRGMALWKNGVSSSSSLDQ